MKLPRSWVRLQYNEDLYGDRLYSSYEDIKRKKNVTMKKKIKLKTHNALIVQYLQIRFFLHKNNILKTNKVE
ncbi:hypothetical protein ALC56_14991 [Trachymyrmex septentrionalis]|uniref:Uncharacterized protein n=1 Tax=Trachymyrmex septentrionalis TaxID=34720 RepID=A0A151JSY8_9HYME|nr:hypothetical protein ALC56_14991 [Trachymyrmex septentrionalis]